MDFFGSSLLLKLHVLDRGVEGLSELTDGFVFDRHHLDCLNELVLDAGGFEMIQGTRADHLTTRMRGLLGLLGRGNGCMLLIAIGTGMLRSTNWVVDGRIAKLRRQWCRLARSRQGG